MAAVTPPSTGPDGGWEKYAIEICPPQGACFTQDCTPVNAPPAPTACTLTGLEPGTAYTVTATAVWGSTTSQQSAPDTFTTAEQG